MRQAQKYKVKQQICSKLMSFLCAAMKCKQSCQKIQNSINRYHILKLQDPKITQDQIARETVYFKILGQMIDQIKRYSIEAEKIEYDHQYATQMSATLLIQCLKLQFQQVNCWSIKDKLHEYHQIIDHIQKKKEYCLRMIRYSHSVLVDTFEKYCTLGVQIEKN